jgi:hypothetical protein
MSEKVHIIRATFNPNIAPSEIGMQWVNTVTSDVFKSTGTAVVGDWVLEPTTGSIDHNLLLNRGTTSHADIDTHIGSTSNPHSVTATQVGRDTAQWNADRLRGVAIHTASPVDGNLFRYNGAESRGEWADASALDELVKVSATDTVSGYLNTKIVSSSGLITKTIVNPAANETLDLDVNESLIDHNSIQNVGTNSHGAIDTFITNTGVTLLLKADRSNVLERNNTASYTPSLEFHPATKGYVDANAGGTLTIAPNEVIPFQTGRYYPLGIQNNTAAGALVGVANLIQLYPVVWPQAGVLADISAIVTTLVAGGNVKILIYDTDINGFPTNLILETANLSTASVGIRTIAFTSHSFTKGKIYWIGMRFSAATNAVRAIPLAAIVPFGGMGLTSVTTYGTCIRRTLTFATAAPATWVWNNAEITNGLLNPAVYVRV